MGKHLVYVREREAEHFFYQFFVHCEIMYVISYVICTCLLLSAGGKFAYLTTTKYVYEYTNDIRTLFGGTSTNASTLHISAKVSLEFPTPCEGVLQVNVPWFMLNISTAG